MILRNEKARLEKIAKNIRYKTGFNGKLMYYRSLEIIPYSRGKTALELGCADGLMAEMLIKYFKKVIAVDGSTKFCKITRNRIKSNNLEVKYSLFEKLELNEKFDTIIMAHIIEHVEDTVLIIKKAKGRAKESGVILIDDPNANSIHRRPGVKMGLLKRVDELNELDKKLGHRRVYNWENLQKDIYSAGLKIKAMGEYF